MGPISEVQQCSQGIDQLGARFRQELERRLDAYEIPRPIMDLIVADISQHSVAAKRDPSHVSFLEAYLQLRDHCTMAVFGGSKLEQDVPAYQRLFSRLNSALGRLLQDGGWSVISGGGPGMAMKGLQYCLKEAKVDGQGRNCLAVSVASGLNDEILHRHSDMIIRSPENIAVRECMIYALAKAALYYPGHFGTNAEVGEGFLENYLVNRGPYPYDPAPMILVSYDMGDGTHFWQRLLQQFEEQSTKARLSKGEGDSWRKLVILPSHKAVGEMSIQERDRVFAEYAKQIMDIATKWVSAKYQNTLTGGFENEQFAAGYRDNWSI
jgi:predicted Rossmann-fold nucleotide-binding protein